MWYCICSLSSLINKVKECPHFLLESAASIFSMALTSLKSAPFIIPMELGRNNPFLCKLQFVFSHPHLAISSICFALNQWLSYTFHNIMLVPWSIYNIFLWVELDAPSSPIPKNWMSSLIFDEPLFRSAIPFLKNYVPQFLYVTNWMPPSMHNIYS